MSEQTVTESKAEDNRSRMGNIGIGLLIILIIGATLQAKVDYFSLIRSIFGLFILEIPKFQPMTDVWHRVADVLGAFLIFLPLTFIAIFISDKFAVEELEYTAENEIKKSIKKGALGIADSVYSEELFFRLIGIGFLALNYFMEIQLLFGEHILLVVLLSALFMQRIMLGVKTRTVTRQK